MTQLNNAKLKPGLSATDSTAIDRKIAKLKSDSKTILERTLDVAVFQNDKRFIRGLYKRF